MREEKKLITGEYVERLKSGSWFILVEYQGLTVSAFSELRNRLTQAGAEIHVIRNIVFKIAAAETGIGELGEKLTGQLAMVTGVGEITGAAKVIKNFHAEFDKPEWRFAFMDGDRLEAGELKILADLPSLEVMRAKLLGLIQTPAGNLVRLINEPALRVARVIQAKHGED